MRVLEAAAKKLRIIVLIASCALLGSTQQGCRLDINSSRPCIELGESCVRDSRCCSGICSAQSSIFSSGGTGGSCLSRR